MHSEELTPKEYEVLHLAANGLAIKEIAKARGVSWRTVRNQLQSAYSKLNAHNRITAINTAKKLGLMKEGIDIETKNSTSQRR
jgi:DNA-binding NarL/FixJ family response regulator